MSEVISLPVNKDYLENISKIQNISSLFEIKINSLKNNKNIDFKAVVFEGAMCDFNLNISNETEKAIKQVAENNVVKFRS